MTEETKDTFAEKVTLEVLFEVSGCALLIIAYPTPDHQHRVLLVRGAHRCVPNIQSRSEDEWAYQMGKSKEVQYGKKVPQ